MHKCLAAVNCGCACHISTTSSAISAPYQLLQTAFNVISIMLMCKSLVCRSRGQNWDPGGLTKHKCSAERKDGCAYISAIWG